MCRHVVYASRLGLWANQSKVTHPAKPTPNIPRSPSCGGDGQRFLGSWMAWSSRIVQEYQRNQVINIMTHDISQLFN